MKLTNKDKEIFECAEKIKEYCNSFEECYGCIFDDIVCHYNGAMDMPECWDLEKTKQRGSYDCTL